ncbi:MAG: 1-(5-phosphoribosyl)-5-[Alphaproteobacteria bacterium]|nr:1-(5-phosphoribosyl)-5-[(5-phosphoribosylamino)methylideneamino]imidazole-4-carboxamide isomerase [Alphaproteobacteria bacterium]
MYLLPAIDLKEGKCVRLKQGDMTQSTVFNNSPAKQAELFAEQGAEWIHVVDLDGAFAGKPMNAAAVKQILQAVDVKIELGGGIRSLETIRFWLEQGVARVILGTAALRDPKLVRAACRDFPGKIAVGIDAKGGFVAVEGWAETSTIKDIDLARQFETAGVSAIIYTNVARDGVLQGPDLDSTLNLAKTVSIPVIVSGGVSSLDDIKACKKAGVFEGVIAGRAIYEGRFTVSEAIALLEEK